MRMAVTYDRMGDYKRAIDSANRAITKFKANSSPAWVALAQAFIQTGDKTQAKAPIASVAGKNPDLARKIGNDWKNAVGHLGAAELKFPLD